MPNDPPDRMPRIIPMISYEDGPAALEWLSRAFGFRERTRIAACELARKWSSVPWVIDGVMVSVDDVDKHFEQAKAAGATILSAPEDQPYGRLYRAEDPEGHRWMFIQPIA